MRLLVIGASKGIGLATVKEALSRGITVRGMARGAHEMAIENQLFQRFAGDALDPGDINRALEDVDAVIVALGIKESISMLWQDVTLFSQATEVLLPAMEKAGIDRLIAVTGFGAGRSRSAMSRLERFGHGLVLGKPYADKDRQEELILDSPLNWTIARPVILTNAARRGIYTVLREPETWRNGLISRADVAVYLLDAIEQGLDKRADVVLTS